MTFLAELTRALIERESVVLPITTTVSGATSSAIVFEVRMMLACASAAGKERGSSAITGHPSFSAKSCTSLSLSPARSWPMTRIPRVDLVKKVPAFLRPNTLGALTFKSSSQPSSLSPTSGSSN
jgi:hypothetical protein